MEAEEDQETRRRRVRCESLDDAVREGMTIEIRCKRCCRKRIVPAEPLHRLARLRGWKRNFIPLGGHLYCAHCSAKWPSVEASSRPPDDGPAIGPVTRLEFEQLKRQLRG